MNTRNTQTTSDTANRHNRYGDTLLTLEQQAINDRENARWRKMYDDLDGPPTPEEAERTRTYLTTIYGHESPKMLALKQRYIARQKAKEEQTK